MFVLTTTYTPFKTKRLGICGFLRDEWGYSHEMADLGLVPITHRSAVIPTSDGNLEIRFKCTKEPVNTAFILWKWGLCEKLYELFVQCINENHHHENDNYSPSN